MKPMLAANIETSAIRLPVYVSAKLDGVRAIVIDGRLVSRNLKPIPNAHVAAMFSHADLNGLDGELIAASPTAKNVFQATTSAVSRQSGKPAVTFYVFDNYLDTGTFAERQERLDKRAKELKARGIVVVTQTKVHRAEDLLMLEQVALTAGYEGLITRAPNGPYKFGRSTANEQWMLKVKRFIDSEAVITDVIEEMANNNLAMVNALGHTERSSAKAGKAGKGRMGALVVRDLTSGVEFQVGTGFTAQDRELFWAERERIVSKGLVVKYKCFPIGVKDLPRFPVYVGIRADFDIS